MTKVAWRSAKSKDVKHDREKFKDLVKILQKHYSIKEIGHNAVYLHLPNELEADIEILFMSASVNKFRVELWYFETINTGFKFNQEYSCHNIADVIHAIDTILSNVKNARRGEAEYKKKMKY